ncbi:hypothetical protein GCM10007874_23450 [Labrys miyagiensis]|uniref:Uncharacterized protein n=1 Tax=Labrys miyagiensis TaxID=346912 RepID=A0ABQ6CHY3_9HYPH|nr:hypothetical protein GCM10007874_23450 [Labrys miyagiensis]
MWGIEKLAATGFATRPRSGDGNTPGPDRLAIPGPYLHAAPNSCLSAIGKLAVYEAFTRDSGEGCLKMPIAGTCCPKGAFCA